MFCYFGLFFALLPPNNPENQNFEIIKKTPVDIIISYMCTINENHDVWFLRYEVQQTELFVILGHFLAPFYPTNNLKNQTFEENKQRKLREIVSFYTCVP